MVFIYIEKSYSIEKERHKNVAVVTQVVDRNVADSVIFSWSKPFIWD